MKQASSLNPRNAAAVALLALAGCTSLEWTKAGASADEARRELHDCRVLAWREAEIPPPRREAPPVIHVSPGPGGTPSVSVLTPRSDPFDGWTDEQRRYAEACMQKKGYSLGPAR